ncbi:MAG: toll/interleukin-1 receptor domain-containing protein [bacterium]
MADKDKSQTETEALPTPATGPLVFISHDSRDADLAEAFSKLLRSVSAGMLKTFRSSDKKGTEGINFGDEWYKRLMANLQSTSDVVCLFTERSLDRPWILYEAGVAKGKLNTPVFGIALGVPLTRVSTGPFYQFQNCDDSEGDLTKLVNQLARRIPTLELDTDVVKAQVTAFKKAEDEILKKLASKEGKKNAEAADGNPIAKLVEEMKSLPSRVAERMMEGADPFRRSLPRRFHPRMIEEMLHIYGDAADPVGILMMASMIRDSAPWLYELAMEVYRAVKSGDPAAIHSEMSRLRRFSELIMRSPFMEEFSVGSMEDHMFFNEFPRMLEKMLRYSLQQKKTPIRRRRLTKPSEQ